MKIYYNFGMRETFLNKIKIKFSFLSIFDGSHDLMYDEGIEMAKNAKKGQKLVLRVEK